MNMNEKQWCVTIVYPSLRPIAENSVLLISQVLGIPQFSEVGNATAPFSEEIATDIGKMGTYIAILIIHVLLFRYFLEGLT